LDWLAATYVTYAVIGSSSGAFTFTIEGTPDDLQATPAASAAWFAMSSATTGNSSLGSARRHPRQRLGAVVGDANFKSFAGDQGLKWQRANRNLVRPKRTSSGLNRRSE
jgi:hypothetical protein